MHALHQLAHAALELLASGIARDGAGQMREHITLDHVDESARFTGGGDQVVPAARREMTAAFVETADFCGDRIAAVEIVQEPGVETVGLQRRLNGRDIDPCGRLKHPASIAWLTEA